MPQYFSVFFFFLNYFPETLGLWKFPKIFIISAVCGVGGAGVCNRLFSIYLSCQIFYRPWLASGRGLMNEFLMKEIKYLNAVWLAPFFVGTTACMRI